MNATAEFATAHTALVAAEAALLTGAMAIDEYLPIWQAANDAQRSLADAKAEPVDMATATDAELDAFMEGDDDAAARAAFAELGRRTAGRGQLMHNDAHTARRAADAKLDAIYGRR